ncbi:hypothetical protein [Lentilactobacillus otakiensis]|uniref:hypothetical protein n=1 Tax=Lentilactobacillus otakiensis TaxID=481720 RepID=UPI003D1774A8
MDLNVELERIKFHNFYRRTFQQAILLTKMQNFKISGFRQHVFDGIVLELYLMWIRKEGKAVQAVKHNTYTPARGTRRTFSDIENGTEFCIRDISVIEDKAVIDWI